MDKSFFVLETLLSNTTLHCIPLWKITEISLWDILNYFLFGNIGKWGKSHCALVRKLLILFNMKILRYQGGASPTTWCNPAISPLSNMRLCSYDNNKFKSAFGIHYSLNGGKLFYFSFVCSLLKASKYSHMLHTSKK